MASVPAAERDVDRAIDALVRDIERRFLERFDRNVRDTTNALVDDAADLKSPTAVRSLLTAVDMLGMGPRRRWRKERRADERRMDAVWSRLGPSMPIRV